MMNPRWLKDLSRSDFVTSVGIYVTPDRFYLVRMRKNLLHLAVLETQSREIAPGSDSAARKQALGDALRSLAHFDPKKDPLYICLSSDQVISLEISFPRVAGDNLAQVVEYEIERHLPFHRDEVYYDFLPIGADGDKVGVLLFAIQKKIIDDVLEVFAGFGVKPRGVESSATALSNYLLFCTGGLSGPALLLGGRDHDLELTGLNGRGEGWKQETVFSFSHRLPHSDWAQGPGREIFFSSLRGSPRFFGWGNAAEFLRSVTQEALPYEDLIDLGKGKLGQGEEIAAEPAYLPAAGAALHGLREATFDVNLVPGAKKEGQGKALSWVNTSLAALLVLGLIGWLGSYAIKDEMRLRQLQKENQKIAPSVEALRREETELNRLRKEIAFFSDLKQRRGVVLRVLDELSRMVPTNAYASNLRLRENNLELQGTAENASNLIPILERSPVFENVAFNAPSSKGRDGRETFSIKADIERPKASAAAKP
jgi:Tfp pilus assembly protein PilN